MAPVEAQIGVPRSLPPIITNRSPGDDSASSDSCPPSPYAASYQSSPMAPLLSSYEDPETVRG